MELNIQLAWNRFKYDIKKRHFFDYNSQINLIENNLVSWLKETKQLFETMNYIPCQNQIYEIPKGNGLVRPGSHLDLKDALYYIVLLSECYPKIYEKVKWSQNKIDFAYIMTDTFDSHEWFANQFDGWSKFREESLNTIEEGYAYTIITDITGYYENIDISILCSDLLSCNIDPKTVDLLRKCLNKWAYIDSKGIPQGQSPSDILSKLYLNSVDLGLRNSEFIHLRYVDDIRIFCHTKSEAKRALMELTKLLRKRGLNLQSAKTKILDSSDAKIEIESVFPIINIVKNKLQDEQIEIIEDPYGYYEDIDEIEEIDKDSIEVIVKTFDSNFISDENLKFNKTLFHYLIKKLIQAKNSFASNYCLSILEEHPEETSYILNYSKSFANCIDKKNSMIDKIITFLNSKNSIYDYQNYLIIEWLNNNITEPCENIMQIIRKYSFDTNYDYYLQKVSRVFLSRFGNGSDFDKIEQQYTLARNEIEKSDIVCCLQKLEKSRRNSFFGRIRDEGAMIEQAINFIQNIAN